MRRRLLFIVVVWMVVPCVFVFMRPAAARATVQEPTSSSKQKKEVQPAQTTVKPVKPVKPVSPGKMEMRVDPHAGDIATAGATEVMVIDLQGDGIDIGGRAKIRVGGSDIDTNWTRINTDDAFVIVNADTIREAGVELTSADGRQIRNRILLSDGVRMRMPDGNEVVCIDPWQMLGEFDSNNDGKVNRNDAHWQHLGLFVDANGDGRMTSGELLSVLDSIVRDLSLRKGSSRRDSHGNTRTDGTFRTTDGSTRTVAGVRFKLY